MRNNEDLRKFFMILLIVSLFMTTGASCGGGGGGNGGGSNPPPPVANDQFVVFAWNDLGMHCLNPTYDEAVILPPYNNLFAQVIKKGNPPQIVTSGLTVEYAVLNNTYSYGKTDTLGAVFAQFWDNALKLFGISLQKDTGLNLVDANVHNGLAGSMLAKTDYFVADGIPVTPVGDGNVWNPYQVAEITVKDNTGKILVQTRTTVPTSDEIDCQRCHGARAFNDILVKHDLKHGTTLVAQKPVLCASCHGDPILGGSGPGTSDKYLSLAIHDSHSQRGASCYDCHPGNTTQCSRSIAHSGSGTDGNCTICHGTMSDIANSISSGTRMPWANEPKCVTCHPVSGVDTGTTLYKNAKGHGNLFCADCHGSPHAMVPTSQASDNYQALQYQKKAKTIASCAACHQNSKGGGSGDFGGKHGGPNPETKSACSICHTSVSSNTALWPHAFQWKNR
jgi:hypothetical protein